VIVAFCLPGRSFTDAFVASWSGMISYCQKKGISIRAAFGYSPIITTARNAVILRSNPMTADVLPFGGAEYDYMMWIDSDMEFTGEQFQALLDADEDIVSGLAVCDSETGALNAGFLDKTDLSAKFLNGRAIDAHPVNEKGLIEVDFAGFAFVLVKRGVFEALERPWFRTSIFDAPDCMIQVGEDVDWCRRVRALGYKVMAHPKVHVGHQKSTMLRF